MSLKQSSFGFSSFLRSESLSPTGFDKKKERFALIGKSGNIDFADELKAYVDHTELSGAARKALFDIIRQNPHHDRVSELKELLKHTPQLSVENSAQTPPLNSEGHRPLPNIAEVELPDPFLKDDDDIDDDDLAALQEEEEEEPHELTQFDPAPTERHSTMSQKHQQSPPPHQTHLNPPRSEIHAMIYTNAFAQNSPSHRDTSPHARGQLYSHNSPSSLGPKTTLSSSPAHNPFQKSPQAKISNMTSNSYQMTTTSTNNCISNANQHQNNNFKSLSTKQNEHSGPLIGGDLFDHHNPTVNCNSPSRTSQFGGCALRNSASANNSGKAPVKTGLKLTNAGFGQNPNSPQKLGQAHVPYPYSKIPPSNTSLHSLSYSTSFSSTPSSISAPPTTGTLPKTPPTISASASTPTDPQTKARLLESKRLQNQLFSRLKTLRDSIAKQNRIADPKNVLSNEDLHLLASHRPQSITTLQSVLAGAAFSHIRPHAHSFTTQIAQFVEQNPLLKDEPPASAPAPVLKKCKVELPSESHIPNDQTMNNQSNYQISNNQNNNQISNNQNNNQILNNQNNYQISNNQNNNQISNNQNNNQISNNQISNTHKQNIVNHKDKNNDQNSTSTYHQPNHQRQWYENDEMEGENEEQIPAALRGIQSERGLQLTLLNPSRIDLEQTDELFGANAHHTRLEAQRGKQKNTASGTAKTKQATIMAFMRPTSNNNNNDNQNNQKNNAASTVEVGLQGASVTFTSAFSASGRDGATTKGKASNNLFNRRDLSGPSRSIIQIQASSTQTTKPAAPALLEVPKQPLSQEQQEIVDFALSGKSFFFTGPAGTGKTFVLKTLIRELRELHGAEHVFVTASTGIAATHIGGTSVHAFSGIGVGGNNPMQVFRRIKSKQAKTRWETCKVLIIDEVSMLSADTLETLDYVGRKMRSRDALPFGGVQLILVGDFFQLPPITDKQATTPAEFCFTSPVWKKAITKSFQLRTIFRQDNLDFQRLLNEIREGQLSPASEQQLRSRINCKASALDIPPTKLFPHRTKVDLENSKQLQLLSGSVHVFKAVDKAATATTKKYLDSLPVPASLDLKEGAQVMLLKNLSFEDGLVNGARGVVTGFVDDLTPNIQEKDRERLRGNPIVRFTSGVETPVQREEWTVEQGREIVASRAQIPLVLAWAISIHKSQGMTIEKMEVSLASAFEPGMAYVALSRAKSLEELNILDFDRRKITAHPAVIEFYKNLK